jgi:hypothetical protein
MNTKSPHVQEGRRAASFAMQLRTGAEQKKAKEAMERLIS